MPTSTTSTTSRWARCRRPPAAGRETTVYRMMFSGSTKPAPPGFRVVDYTFTRANGALTVTPTVPMRLCPQITRDLATPFISKDGRYVIAHDDSRPGVPASLKIFEITATDPAAQTTTCAVRADFGFAAGKADFSFDGTPGGVPHQQARLPDAVRERRPEARRRSPTWSSPTWSATRAARSPASAACRGSPPRPPKASATTSRRSCPTARSSTSRTLVPKQSPEPKRFQLTVVDPAGERRVTDAVHFAGPARSRRRDRRVVAADLRAVADAVPAAGSGVGVPEPGAGAVPQLVQEQWLPATDARKAALLAACTPIGRRRAPSVDRGRFLAVVALPHRTNAIAVRNRRRLRPVADSVTNRRPRVPDRPAPRTAVVVCRLSRDGCSTASATAAAAASVAVDDRAARSELPASRAEAPPYGRQHRYFANTRSKNARTPRRVR